MTSNDHAAVSSADPAAISVTTNAAASVPIATSTPVNLAAGPLSPPPLTLAAGQGPHHEHPPGAAPTVKVTSYPAVLKGRSAASPPNPNLVPSGKVPPPVPPRGTGASRTARSSEDHRAAGTTASTTSSVTSSRGDEAAIITRYRLHDSSCNLHHPFPFLLSDHPITSTSIITAKTVASTITAATSTKATSATSNALHARTSASNTYRVTHFGREAERIRPMDLIQDWRTEELDENKEEFISVEKVKEAYFIKTSLHPLRPDRGIRRLDYSKDSGGTIETGNRKVSKRDRERRDDTKTDHPAKFTYFFNPGSRADLMNYKMSRKDKKHSETYYEKIKRKQNNLEASVTTMSHRHKSMENARTSRAENKLAEEYAEQKILKFASIKKDSILLQKIREKSKRKKRLAPKPSMKKRISVEETFNENLTEMKKRNTKREDEILSLKVSSLRNKNNNNQIQGKSNKNDTCLTSEKQSAIKCDESKQNCSSDKDNNYLDERNISKNINDEQRNNKSEFRRIFVNSYRVGTEIIADKIVRERTNKFDRHTNERLKRYKHESPRADCKNCDESSFLRKGGSLFDDIKKSNVKDANRYKLLSTAKGKDFVSSSFNGIRNRDSDIERSSISEQVKTFEKIKADVRDGTKNARREDIHSDNLDKRIEISAVKQEFALPINKIRLNKKEERFALKGRPLNTDARRERQTFKSFSSGHCDLSFNPESEMLKPNASFLHTYQKTQSFT